MRQPSMKCVGELITLGGLVVGGLEALQVELKLHYADAATMKAELDEVTDRQSFYGLGKQEMNKRSTRLKNAVKRTREFVRVSRDALKPVLGYHYSQNWEALGFYNTLMIPMTAARLVPMMHYMVGYLAENPGRAVTDLGVTLAEAKSVQDELLAAHGAIAQQDSVLEGLLLDRNTWADKLRRSIRRLIGELHNVLTPDDARWFRFGLNQPSAKERPGTPKKPEVQIIQDEAAGFKWPRVPGAEHYRVYRKTLNSEEEPVAVATVYAPHYVAETLPTEADMELSVSAVNSGGESRRSEPLVVRGRPQGRMEEPDLAAVSEAQSKTLPSESFHTGQGGGVAQHQGSEECESSSANTQSSYGDCQSSTVQ